MIEIFPHMLLRIAGSPFEELAVYARPELDQGLNRIANLSEETHTLKKRFSQSLFNLIEGQANPKRQNLLQNFRRDVYNGRKIKASTWSQVQPLLPQSLIAEFELLQSHIQKIENYTGEWKRQYQMALLSSRVALQRYSNNEVLKKGLVLSAPDLLDRLPTFEKKEPKDFRKKDYHTEKSLIKYMTRIAGKTSPFSTFTNLAIMKIGDKGPKIFSGASSVTSSHVRSTIRINNYLLKYLKDIFFHYKALRLHFFIRPNPTIELVGGSFNYLINFNNIESFQKLRNNPVLELILELLEKDRRGITFSNLLVHLQEYVDAGIEALEAYVQELLKYGFLEYNLGVSGLDPNWDQRLIEALSPCVETVNHIQELLDVLRQLRIYGEEFAKAPANARMAILKQAHQSFKSICMKIHEAAELPEVERKSIEELRKELKEKAILTDEKVQEETNGQETKFSHFAHTRFTFSPTQIFFEDTVKDADLSICAKAVKPLLEKVSALASSLSFFPYSADELDRMKSYFLDHYPKDQEISFLGFYEDYFRDVRKVHEKHNWETIQKRREVKKKGLASSEDLSDKPNASVAVLEKPQYLTTKEIESRRALYSKWTRIAASTFKQLDFHNSQTVSLTQELIEGINEKAQMPDTIKVFASNGAFIQFFREGGKLKGFLPVMLPGNGKWMGRFLHAFPEEVTEDLLAWNNMTLELEDLHIESTDASYFNANLHPCLMPYEIQTPGGHNTLHENLQLKVSDFRLRYNDLQGQMELVHSPSGKRAFTYNLGFQSLPGRSKLFQLLSNFGESEFLGFGLPINAINSLFEEGLENLAWEDKVLAYPRISYEDILVLQRRMWKFGKNTLPRKLPNEPDADFFKKVRGWVATHNLPNQVFITLNPHRHNQAVDPELIRKLRRDDYKPQYIDFQSPLLVNYFEKMLRKMSDYLIIEEMLPSSDQLFAAEGKNWVTECVVQWCETPED